MSNRQTQGFSRATLLALLLIVLTTCGDPPATQRREESHPSRIVSLSPSATEILYGVGAWPQVVAVSQYCTYPDDVINKPRVGGWGSTNLEQVTALKPDLVIGVDAQEPFVKDKLSSLGMRSLFVKSQSLEDVLTAIDEIGRHTGHEQEGAELIKRTRRELDEVRAAVANRQHPRVLCVVDRVPGTLRDIYVAAPGSFIDELIGVAGGESIAPRSGHGYALITKEAVLSLNPEVIIEMVQGASGKLAEDPGAVWQGLSEVRAVRDRRVYSLRDPSVIHPSQFVGRTARIFAHHIHPEVFPDGPGKQQ